MGCTPDCFWANRDLRIGDRIRVGLDEAIRRHNKLLLILSESSMSSRWVEHEVEVALARETEQDRDVLFPIRLDDSVMRINTGWPAHICRTRVIGDFRDWKSHESYQRELSKLIEDLTVDADKTRARRG